MKSASSTYTPPIMLLAYHDKALWRCKQALADIHIGFTVLLLLHYSLCQCQRSSSARRHKKCVTGTDRAGDPLRLHRRALPGAAQRGAARAGARSALPAGGALAAAGSRGRRLPGRLSGRSDRLGQPAAQANLNPDT